jgi:hypothetical protein
MSSDPLGKYKVSFGKVNLNSSGVMSLTTKMHKTAIHVKSEQWQIGDGTPVLAFSNQMKSKTSHGSFNKQASKKKMHYTWLALSPQDAISSLPLTIGYLNTKMQELKFVIPSNA